MEVGYVLATGFNGSSATTGLRQRVWTFAMQMRALCDLDASEGWAPTGQSLRTGRPDVRVLVAVTPFQDTTHSDHVWLAKPYVKLMEE